MFYPCFARPDLCAIRAAGEQEEPGEAAAAGTSRRGRGGRGERGVHLVRLYPPHRLPPLF